METCKQYVVINAEDPAFNKLAVASMRRKIHAYLNLLNDANSMINPTQRMCTSYM